MVRCDQLSRDAPAGGQMTPSRAWNASVRPCGRPAVIVPLNKLLPPRPAVTTLASIYRVCTRIRTAAALDTDRGTDQTEPTFHELCILIDGYRPQSWAWDLSRRCRATARVPCSSSRHVTGLRGRDRDRTLGRKPIASLLPDDCDASLHRPQTHHDP